MSRNSRETICGKLTSESEIQGSSYSFSLTSEPPDIRNWFPSYVYESPTLDVDSDFSESLISSIQTENKKEGFRNPRLRGAPAGGERSSLNGLVQCDESFKNNNQDKLLENKSKHCVEGTEGSPVLSKFVPEGTNEEKLEDEPDKCCDFTSIRYDKSSSLINGNPLQELEGKPSKEKFNKTSGLERLHFCKELFDSKDGIKNPINQACSSSPKGNVDLKGVNEVYSNKVVLQGNGKDNGENGSVENGFISTRKEKNTIVDDVSFMKRRFWRNADVGSVVGEENAGLHRKALTERTNFQYEAVQEIAGKWQCPQKGKPNLGPPLKQLRMERWVHRV